MEFMTAFRGPFDVPTRAEITCVSLGRSLYQPPGTHSIVAGLDNARNTDVGPVEPDFVRSIKASVILD